MDNALQQYLQQKNKLASPDEANAPLLQQNAQSNTDVLSNLTQSQQELANALAAYKNGSNGQYSAYDPNLSAIGQQASLFGVSNAPVTEVFGQRQPGIELFSHGITNGTGFAMPLGTPLSLPKGQWNVLQAYAGAKGRGHIGDGTNSGYGNSVLVKNANTGETLRFSHLSKVGVQPGQTLQGGIFALSGDTGNASGPHLNLEYYTPQGQLGDVLKSQYTQGMLASGNTNQPKGGGNPLSNFFNQNRFDNAVNQTGQQIGNLAMGAGRAIGNGIGWEGNAIQTGIEQLVNPQQYAKDYPNQQPQQNPLQMAQHIIQPPHPQVAQANVLSAVTPTPTQAPSPTIDQAIGATDYEKQAAPIFEKYGVPPAVGLGMYAMEGRGKTINPNNPYNIGALDSNPQNANAYHFASPIEGTEEAAKFLAGKSQFQTPSVQKIFQSAMQYLKKTNDVEGYLKQIAPTYSTNPQYPTTVMQTPEYQRWAGGR